MTTRPLCIWSSVELSASAAELARNLGPQQEWHATLNEAELPLERVEVMFGQPSLEVIRRAPKLAWVQVSSAGYTRYASDEVQREFSERGIVFTTSSSVFAGACAEHALSLMLAGARQLPRAIAAQLGSHDWPKDEIRVRSSLLTGQRVVLVGYGAIGRRLAQLLAPFRLHITAIRRAPLGNEAIQVVSEAEAQSALASADHVVNLLPENSATLRWFDRERFAVLKPGASFYNIGRGTTVDQDALLDALTSGQLRAAYLDVTEPEPLPASHPLWTAPGCTITPHTAGGHGDETLSLLQHFLENLQRFEAGEALLDRVLG